MAVHAHSGRGFESSLSGQEPIYLRDTCACNHITCRPTLQLSSPDQGSASMVCLCGSAPFHQRAKPSKTAQPTGKPCQPHAVPDRPTGAPPRNTHLYSTPCSLFCEGAPQINPWLPTVPFHCPQNTKLKCTALSGLRSARSGTATWPTYLTLHVSTLCWPRVICACAAA